MVSLLALTTPLSAASAQGDPQAASHAAFAVHTSAGVCGGNVIHKSDGSNWVCTFDDEFSGTRLDSTKWTTWNNLDYFSYPNLCYYSDPQHVNVSGGYLNLSVTKLVTAKQCQTPLGDVTANYGAGVVHTLGNFSQTYGRYEARIKFGGTDNLHDDFWLYPVSNNYPGQAEIDIAEPFGGWGDTMVSATHVTGANGQDDGGVGLCTISSWDSAFHTYSVVWTPTAITFSYDGTQCYSFSNWSTLAGYASPAPFNQPFFMILQTLLDTGTTDASTALPATTQVDYVRVWK